MEILRDECKIGSENIGALPVLASFLKRMGIASFVDLFQAIFALMVVG